MDLKKNKLRVAWICHFSNEEVRGHLPLSKNRLQNLLRSFLKKSKLKSYSDFAPWISNLIKEFEKFDNIELHIISPHKGLKRIKSEFNIRGINYHFFQSDFPILHIDTNSRREKPKFKRNRKSVSKFIKNIKPDIVNLIGAENPYYSITALDINNIPIYLSCQTVYSNPLRKIHANHCDNYRWELEKRIHDKVTYFGCTGRMHRDLVLNNNPEATVFKMFFPMEKPKKAQKVEKEFDFVFFAAAVTKKKGIEDAIDALSKVCEERPSTTLNIVGRWDATYKIQIHKRISEAGLQDNIIFNEYFPIHSDMHQHIVKSKYALLPVKLDIIPGSVVEAILLDLPVITYKTTGTPYINRNGERILISDIGNTESLAKQMLRLMDSKEFADKRARDAKVFVEQEFDNAMSAQRLADNYKSVINHYHYNIPIPKDQLFSTEEFPLY